jgi:chromosome segregation ATPase
MNERLSKIRSRAARLSASRDSLTEDLTRREGEVVELTARLERLSKVTELFRRLMDRFLEGQVRRLEELVTSGLHSIFDGMQLSLEADVGLKYNKVAIDFFFRRWAKDNPESHRGRPLDSFGGGPASIASLALRILTILRLQLYPLLVLDESLGAVSEAYEANTSRFLRVLSDRTGISTLIVTHKPTLAEHANSSYSCREVVDTACVSHLEIEKLR